MQKFRTGPYEPSCCSKLWLWLWLVALSGLGPVLTKILVRLQIKNCHIYALLFPCGALAFFGIDRVLDEALSAYRAQSGARACSASQIFLRCITTVGHS